MVVHWFQQLYNLGARKVALIGIGQVGCIPYELARNRNANFGRNNNQCNETINRAITMFNNGLVRIVNRFNRERSEAKFIYVNIYESSNEIGRNAASYGNLLFQLLPINQNYWIIISKMVL